MPFAVIRTWWKARWPPTCRRPTKPTETRSNTRGRGLTAEERGPNGRTIRTTVIINRWSQEQGEYSTTSLIWPSLISSQVGLRLIVHLILGAVHKVRHARGEGVREGVTVCDRGRGVKSMWRHAYTNFYHTYETWNLKWCLTLCCNRCIMTEGGTDKNQPEQNPRTKTSANNWDRICTGGTLICPGFLY